ncbi:MAG TPA: DUF4142 domain-containing protein [Acidobacteriaceae bacterium]|nr:DUF4142 domain-containing protein [Acidobacteriaceae bacterium]
MNSTARKVCTIAAAALVTSALAFAQMGGPPANPPQQNPNAGNMGMNHMQQMEPSQQEPPMQAMQDKGFVHDALQGGMAEVKLGHLAEQKGASADVRQFGAKMVNDHTQLDTYLLKAATSMEMPAPKHIAKKDKKLYEKLSALSGTQFDDAYIKAMVKGHEKALAAFRLTAENTQLPDLKQTAEQGSQIVYGHLQLIKKIAKDHHLKS